MRGGGHGQPVNVYPPGGPHGQPVIVYPPVVPLVPPLAAAASDATPSDATPRDAGMSVAAAKLSNASVDAAPPMMDIVAASSAVSQASWTRLSEMTPADALPVDALFAALMEPANVIARLMSMLRQGRDVSISPVSMLEHNVQMATRALRAGWSVEWVVGALLHDVGEVLIPNGHGEIAASILRPYVTPELYWAIAHHEMFQFHHCTRHPLAEGRRRPAPPPFHEYRP